MNFIFDLRPVAFWLHLATGAIAGVVILILCVTGLLLTFQRQIVAWADHAPTVHVLSSRAPLEAVVAAAEAAQGARASQVVRRADPRHPVTVTFTRGSVVYVDPYRAQIVGYGSTVARAFFREVTEWHRWLGAGPEKRAAARSITGAANLALLFLVGSGVILWWPRRWSRTSVRAVLVPSFSLRGRARDFNWHNAAGFFSAVPLAVIVTCATVISYPWAGDLLSRAFGEKPSRREASGARATALSSVSTGLAGLDPLLASAAGQVPGWQSLTMRLPVLPDTVAITLDRGDGTRPDLRTEVILDRRTGAASPQPFAAQPRGRQVRSWMRWIHTGEALGLPGQTAAGLACLGGTVLVGSGLALAWRRAMGRRHRHRTMGGQPVLPALDSSLGPTGGNP